MKRIYYFVLYLINYNSISLDDAIRTLKMEYAVEFDERKLPTVSRANTLKCLNE